MQEPLRVASLDGAGRVRRVGLLRPGRVFFDAGARWVMELPLSCPPPALGERLTVARPVHTAAFDLLP